MGVLVRGVMCVFCYGWLSYRGLCHGCLGWVSRVCSVTDG